MLRPYLLRFLVLYALGLGAANVQAWRPPPTEPPPKGPPPLAPRTATTPLPGNPTPAGDPTQAEFKYVNFRPGQIILESSRLDGVLQDILFYSNRTNAKASISRIEITGFADQIPIVDKNKVWGNLPPSVRPNSPQLISNMDIAEGRAFSISEHLRKSLGYQLPTTVKIISIPDLPVGGANRGVQIKIDVIPSRGLQATKGTPP